MTQSDPANETLSPTRVVVAVDGPAGSGKSSVSKAAATALGFDYQDTGAAYRALAWFVLERGVAPEDQSAVVALLAEFDYSAGVVNGHLVVRVGAAEVTDAIREPRISAVVSRVARIPDVRETLTGLFRSRIASGDAPGIITEGRDITTVVAPDAQVRVLLTASEAARMARRAAELDTSGFGSAGLGGEAVENVRQQLSSRDAQDSQVVDFMNAAPGVTTLDSTDLDFDQTVAALVTIIRDSHDT